MNNTAKVVISNTLTESPWENAVVAGGDLVEAVNRLKAEPGGGDDHLRRQQACLESNRQRIAR